MKKSAKFISLFLMTAFVICSDSFSLSFGDILQKAVQQDNLQKTLSNVEKVKDTVTTINRAAEPITPIDAYEIGRTVSASVLEIYPLYNSPKATAYLNKICKALALNSDVPSIYKDYCVEILNSEEINALSTSGGHIFISLGLLKCCNSEDAVAAVIAHELAHIQLEHSVNAIKASRKTEALTQTTKTAADLTNDYADIAKEDKEIFTNLTYLNEAALDKLLETGYPKEQEYKADELALTIMARTGYDPNAMIDMLNVLNELHSKESGDDKGWKKTHPKPADRIKKVKASVSKNKLSGTDKSAREARFKTNLSGIVK